MTLDQHAGLISARVQAVRQALVQRGWQALIVPSSDPHLSEYLPTRWQGRQWLSGFDGSAGILVVTQTEAALLTDSRYWEQAQAQLHGTDVSLVKAEQGSFTDTLDWLTQRLPAGSCVSVDGAVLALSTHKLLQYGLQDAGIRLVSDADLLNEIWPDRPALPAQAVVAHELPHAVHDRLGKLTELRQTMQKHGASHLWLSALDDIAWLLNLRGSDVPYNPVFLAHVLVDDQAVHLFVADGVVADALRAQLEHDGIVVGNYHAFAQALTQLPANAVLMYDPARVTHGLRQCVLDRVRCLEQICPVMLRKARKSEAELDFVRQAMRHDGAAMAAFYTRFEAALQQGMPVSELTVDEWLREERQKQPDFRDLSFPTIAGFAANGALPHYRATVGSYSSIQAPGLLLIDSGAQYLGGTTDITRVWAIGELTATQKRDCTLVLRGTIALSRTVFPEGTLGPMLDAIARAPLWQHGLDFGHGTGHGVGYYLNVHEPPQRISKGLTKPEMAMRKGMITSIEPGVYRAGQWGVRIENLVATVAHATPEADQFGAMLAFDTLTLCPIDRDCIDLSLLRADELQWVNAYHARVRQELSPLVQGEVLRWLNQRTEAWSL